MAAQQEWLDKDYYKALGVSKGASEKEIQSAYRKLAKKLHPDANPGDKKAEERFKEVSAAYDVLGDPKKRKEYDELRSLGGAMGGMGGGPRGGNPFGTGGPPPGAGRSPGGFRFEDLGDLFGGIFGGGGGATRPRGTGPQRGDDLEASLQISFMESIHGLTTSVNVMGDAPCETCHGSGAQPGTSPVVCPVCQGRGIIDDNQGVFSLSQPCQRCGGVGRIVQNPCKTCKGIGVQRRARHVKVRMPAGVANGQRVRLKGRGGAGKNGGPAGDLFVTVTVAPDPLFGRQGDDITVSVPVTYPELVFGAVVKAPTPAGHVSLRVPAGTKPGTVLRAKGHGIDKGEKGKGDLRVTLDLVVPDKPTDAEKKAIDALAAVTSVGERLRDKLGKHQ